MHSHSSDRGICKVGTETFVIPTHALFAFAASLLGQSVYSRSTLVLMEKTTPLIPPQQPSSLVADTLAVNMVSQVKNK